MFSLIAFCKGENESDLRSIIFPIVTPLLSEDCDTDVLMNPSGRAANLIAMFGSLPGGIGTLVDVTQLLATVQKALSSPAADSVKCETSSANADGTSSSDHSSILGPPPLMSCKPSIQVSSKTSQFAFNHVLASHIQAQLIQRMTMPPSDEPVPVEARIPVSSLGSVVSLFDLPLVRPLIAKSSQKDTTAHMSQTAIKPTSTSSATDDGILGRAPAARMQGPQTNAAVPMAPGRSSSNIRPFQGPPPPIRPPAARNFAGASNWPRPHGAGQSVMTSQGGDQQQWSGGRRDSDNSKSGTGWQWNTEAGGQHWGTRPETIQPDFNYSGGLRGRKPTNVPHKAPAGQSTFPNIRGKPPQVCYTFCVL